MGWGIGLGRALLRGRYGVSLCRFDGKWKGKKRRRDSFIQETKNDETEA
jgi:hypothetical protein